jgi:hypothetical protein
MKINLYLKYFSTLGMAGTIFVRRQIGDKGNCLVQLTVLARHLGD